MWWTVFCLAIAVGLFGDAAMKQAGIGGSVHWPWFWAGFLSYSGTSFAWFWLLRTRTLSSLGTLYPVANALGLVLLGCLVFGETLDRRTIAGVLVGGVAIWLLGGR